MKIVKIVSISKCGNNKQFSKPRHVSLIPQFFQIPNFYNRLILFIKHQEITYKGQYNFNKITSH